MTCRCGGEALVCADCKRSIAEKFAVLYGPKLFESRVDGNTRFTFGKHAEKTFSYVFLNDPTYGTSYSKKEIPTIFKKYMKWYLLLSDQITLRAKYEATKIKQNVLKSRVYNVKYINAYSIQNFTPCPKCRTYSVNENGVCYVCGLFLGGTHSIIFNTTTSKVGRYRFKSLSFKLYKTQRDSSVKFRCTSAGVWQKALRQRRRWQ